MNLAFDRVFEPRYGEAVPVAPGVRRITARNPGIFTFMGTNTYLVGARELAVIDPGPDDAAHVAAILAAADGTPIGSIVLTHGHADHSGGAAALKAATGAPVFSSLARTHRGNSGDPETTLPGLVSDREISDGMEISGPDWRLVAVATPGHASDHYALGLRGTDILFTGDHVMGWSTSIVAPPDGSMRDYMASLEALLRRKERRYLPGHGGAIADGPAFARGLAAHRREREDAIIERLRAGDRRIGDIVANVYRDTDPRLHSAAALSVLAHLEALVGDGRVVASEPVGLESDFKLA